MDNKQQERKRRQQRLAKLFYEMGMDDDVITALSGLNIEEVNKVKKDIDTNRDAYYNDLVKKTKNDSY